jgi:diguanylate cyclase (GGDEF)-like protein
MASPSSAPTLHQILAKAHRHLALLAVTLATASLLLCGVLIIQDYVTRGLTLTARTISYAVEPAVVFNDMDAVKEGVTSIAGNITVERLEIVDGKGRRLVTWSRSGKGLAHWIGRWGSRMLWPQPVVEEIRKSGDKIAEVRVFGSAFGIGRFLVPSLIVAFCCIGITIIATHMLARRLRAGVVDPLKHVADVAHSVRMERAFHRRVPAPGVAEVDDFVEDFNSLLSELQGWYAGLAQENEKLAWQALHDPLTGLGNRARFEARLEALTAGDGERGACFAVLYLDGNRFKQINDQNGHDAGDAVLRAVAKRLQRCIRNIDMAFRLGGDEFAIILSPQIDRGDVDIVVKRITEALEEGISLPDGSTAFISFSVGRSIYPENGTSPAELIRSADQAMYDDKMRRRQDGASSHH